MPKGFLWRRAITGAKTLELSAQHRKEAQTLKPWNGFQKTRRERRQGALCWYKECSSVHWGHSHSKPGLELTGVQNENHLKIWHFLMTSWEKLTHWKRPWCWERLRAGEGGNRMRWLDVITDSTDRVWATSRRWWWTGRPGVLQSMGSWRAGHNFTAEQQQWFYALQYLLSICIYNVLNLKTIDAIATVTDISE